MSRVTASDAMTKNPKTVKKGTLAVLVLSEMETYNITQMIVVDEGRHPAGVIHLHDLVKTGLGGDETT
jgi:arabinose-5-phosphate isomerase